MEGKIKAHHLLTLFIFVLLGFQSVQALAACSNPAKPEATVWYNTTHNVMQYCNDTNWIAFGPANSGAPGGGCSNPGMPEGSLHYNTTYNTLQYCDGSTWIQVGRSADSLVTLSDNFNRADNDNISTGSSIGWSEIIPDSSECDVDIATNELAFKTGLSGAGCDYTVFQARAETALNSANQWVKVKFASTDLSDAGASSGTVVRAKSGAGLGMHYEFRCGSRNPCTSIRVERVDGNSFQEAMTNDTSCDGTEGWSISVGDYFATAVEGTDTDTVFRMWDFGTSDPGDDPTSWGAPTCSISVLGGTTKVDSGVYTGLRVYTAGAGASQRLEYDDFGAGDYDPLTDGLVGYWKLDETTGTTIYDSAGPNDGTVNQIDPASDSVAGKVGTALYFDGVNDYIDTTNGGELDVVNNGDWSVFAWINPLQGGNPSQDNMVIQHLDGGGTGRNIINIDEDGNDCTGNNVFYSRLGNDDKCSDYEVQFNGGWIHVGFTVTEAGASDEIDWYINGEFTRQRLTNSETNDGGGFRFGASKGVTEDYEGDIDEVRIYDRVLTASEIATLALSCENPVAPPGSINYNSSTNVMAYCNGTDWMRIGK